MCMATGRVGRQSAEPGDSWAFAVYNDGQPA